MNNVYTIKDLENLSGIKAHTIRIWEKRYKLIEPKRTDTNIRLYTEPQLQKLIYISLLNKNGVKISKLAKLNEDELREKVKEFSEKHSGNDTLIEDLILSLVKADESNFRILLNASIKENGLENTMLNTIYPFLEKVGQLWLSGSITPSQEHLVSNTIRHRLIEEIGKLEETDNPNTKTFLLFLPENEMHEIGLLFAHYILKKNNKNVIYLGQRVPVNDLKQLSKIKHFDVIFTTITHTLTTYKLQPFFDKLSETFADKKILVSGNMDFISKLEKRNNIAVLNTPHDILGY